MSITTEKPHQQPKKEYQPPTLANQGKLDQKTLTGNTSSNPDLTASS